MGEQENWNPEAPETPCPVVYSDEVMTRLAWILLPSPHGYIAWNHCYKHFMQEETESQRNKQKVT